MIKIDYQTLIEETDIAQYYNIKYKRFLNSEQIIVYSKPVVIGITSPHKGKTKKQIEKKVNTIEEFRIKRVNTIYHSSKRSKKMIFDVTRSNIWEWFVTITFNPEMVDSKDYDACTKKLSIWLNNIRKRQCPTMKYIFVPELHKSGRYHFHGLISDCSGMQFEESGHYDKGGNMIYNIGKYKLGFTTATKIRNSEAAEKYIAKYVTKELTSTVKGKRRYWKSKNCSVPVVEYYMQENTFINEKGEKQEYDVHQELHQELINRNGYQYGQEKEYTDRNGSKQFVRYYEYKGEDNSGKNIMD